MSDKKNTPLPIAVDGSERDLQSILSALLQAFECARDVAADTRHFAIEITSLPDSVINNTLLRWLIAKGYVEHRFETTLPGEQVRSFRSAGRLQFREVSCFVLTESGVEFAKAALQEEPAALPRSRRAKLADDLRRAADRSEPVSGPQPPIPTGGDGLPPETTPVWDPLRRELRVGDCVVKRFKLPLPNQETVLMAFEEEGWPQHIYDPLPPRPDHDTKMCLQNAIEGLNRHQRHRLIRFMGDGTGEGVLWEIVAPGE